MSEIETENKKSERVKESESDRLEEREQTGDRRGKVTCRNRRREKKILLPKKRGNKN